MPETDIISSHPGKHWHQLEDGRIQCDICPRECKLREGQRGLCFVRARNEDELVLTTYGRSSGFCIDPIEKKPLMHFLPGTPVLSFGTAGCNLSCKFCQNWDISKARSHDKLQSEISPKDIAQMALSNKCRSVAFTYNDPIIFHEYAIDTAFECRKLGIKTVAVSAGYHKPAARAEFYQHIDAVNIDLKGFTEYFYDKLCAGTLKDVLDTLAYINNETDVWLEITTLLIPGENDSASEIKQMCRWIVQELGCDVPLHFSAFHPDWKMMDKEKTPASTLFRARHIAMEEGIKYVYCGNVKAHQHGATYCPTCGEKVIGRDWHQLTSWHLHQGKCGSCGSRIAGVFDERPGNWGRMRKPIDVSRFLQNLSESQEIPENHVDQRITVSFAGQKYSAVNR